MQLRLLLVLICCGATTPTAIAFEAPGVFPPRIFENFDSHPGGFELANVYPLVNSANPTGATVTDSPILYPGIEGGAAGFDEISTMNGAIHRIRNDELAILDPSIFGTLVFRVDIYDDGVSEIKRAQANIRFQLETSGAMNMIQVGFRPFPGAEFGHMQGGFAVNPLPGWQGFQLPEEMNERAEIGPGWHRFSVLITMTELVYQLDLHRDGTVDAIDIVPAIMNPVGFNEMRFGKQGFHPEPTLIAFDNLFFAVIPEPGTATSAIIASVAVLLTAGPLRTNLRRAPSRRRSAA